MTNAGQPPGISERLSRLETLFANVGEAGLSLNSPLQKEEWYLGTTLPFATIALPASSGIIRTIPYQGCVSLF